MGWRNINLSSLVPAPPIIDQSGGTISSAIFLPPNSPKSSEFYLNNLLLKLLFRFNSFKFGIKSGVIFDVFGNN